MPSRNRLCVFNIPAPGLTYKQLILNVCPCQYSQSSNQQGCRNLYQIKPFFFVIFDDLSIPQKKFYPESLSKISLVMTLPHHPIHSLSMVGHSLALYLHLTSFGNINPYPQICLIYIQSIYEQSNPTKVCLVSNIVTKLPPFTERNQYILV